MKKTKKEKKKKKISSKKDFQPRKRTWMGVSSKAASISKQEKGGEKPSEVKKKILNRPFLIGLHAEERESRSRLA